MKVLVTGATGQLGQEILFALQAAGENVAGIGRNELDFANSDLVAETIAAHRADWVINCAAYTQVDRAEEDADSAFKINRDSARAVAEGVKLSNGRLVHMSTDFVFSGEQSCPYREDAAPAPLGVYGQSKWEGEQAVLDVLPGATVIRTAWIYGNHGNNFVKTILALAAARDELRVVDDQIGTPSWTADVFRAIWTLIKVDASGVFHFTNEGVASWYDFAHEIVSKARALGMSVKAERITPISTMEYPLPAKRPSYSVLNKERIRSVLGYPIPHWTDSLGVMLEAMNERPQRSR